MSVKPYPRIAAVGMEIPDPHPATTGVPIDFPDECEQASLARAVWESLQQYRIEFCKGLLPVIGAVVSVLARNAAPVQPISSMRETIERPGILHLPTNTAEFRSAHN